MLVGAALAQRSYTFGIMLVVAAAVPWSAPDWQRSVGSVLAFAGLIGVGIFLVPLSARASLSFMALQWPSRSGPSF